MKHLACACAAMLAAVYAAGCGSSVSDAERIGKPILNAPAGDFAVGPAVRPVVDQPPPALQKETPGPQPTAQHVWVPGWWGWDSVKFVWRPGEWTVPPSPSGLTFCVRPRWERLGEKYRFEPGCWKSGTPE